MGLALYALRDLDQGVPYDIWVQGTNDTYPTEDGQFYFSDSLYESQEDYFEGRAKPLVGGMVYTAANPAACVDVSMGAYSTYGVFRSLVSEFDSEVLDYNSWFWKIVEFSDCEGIIGSQVADELYDNLTQNRGAFMQWLAEYVAAHEENFVPADIDWYMRMWDDLTRCCDVARNNGAIIFC